MLAQIKEDFKTENDDQQAGLIIWGIMVVGLLILWAAWAFIPAGASEETFWNQMDGGDWASGVGTTGTDQVGFHMKATTTNITKLNMRLKNPDGGSTRNMGNVQAHICEIASIDSSAGCTGSTTNGETINVGNMSGGEVREAEFDLEIDLDIDHFYMVWFTQTSGPVGLGIMMKYHASGDNPNLRACNQTGNQSCYTDYDPDGQFYYDYVPPAPTLSELFQPNQYIYGCEVGKPCLIGFNYDKELFVGPADTLTVYQCDQAAYGSDFDNPTLTCDTPTEFNTLDIQASQALFGYSAGNIIFPITGSEENPTRRYYMATIQKDGSSDLYEPVYFYVLWQPAGTWGFGNSTSTASTTISNLFLGQTPHDAACTSAEWTDAESSWWTAIRCNAVRQTYELIANTGAFISNRIADATGLLGNIFPFNFPVKIYQSWTASAATSSLPVGLEFMDIIDGSGNIYFDFPAEWGGTATATPMLIYGPTMLAPEGTTAADFFAGIRTLSTYLLWGAFIWGIYNYAAKVKDDLDE